MTAMTMKAKLHYYRHDTQTPAGEKAYADMVAAIKANEPAARGTWMKSISMDNNRTRHGNETVEVEIELKHIFSNQWNAATGRVFDWYEEVRYHAGRKAAPHIKVGHWLELTPELAEVRTGTSKCGYCGRLYGEYYSKPEGAFCTRCLDSEYLNPEDLKLLRLHPLTDYLKKFPELTDAEKDELMPQYVKRQTEGIDSRMAAKMKRDRADIESKYKSEVHAAKVEHDGKIWLLDHNFPLDNVIYYSHTGIFSFGWRNPVSKEVEKRILEIISEFNYPYEIKCADGRVLNGNVE